MILHYVYRFSQSFKYIFYDNPLSTALLKGIMIIALLKENNYIFIFYIKYENVIVFFK